MKRTPTKKPAPLPKRVSTLPRRIGRALKARRKELKLNQDDAAERMGTHRVNYSRLETGKVKYRIDTLEKLCMAVDRKPWQVLKEAEELLK
ncbi:MAG TPA: helix-turn-helix transcriptional regulator [Povalibacter sp.]|nr:helix-turn-helix transcriptional regulator [Povalibacter sp.]